MVFLATSAIAAGLMHSKSLSHDGRVLTPVDIGGEGLLRSLSTEGSSPMGSADSASPNADLHSCGCLEGAICTCCRDRAGHVISKPSKSSSQHAVFKNYQSKHQRGAASLDLGKSLLHLRDVSPLGLSPHTPGMQAIHSPDGSVSSNSSLGINGTFTGMGISSNGSNTQFAQVLNSGSSGCDHQSSASSPLSSQQNQIQSHLCFDYASSSDYDSDHYNPPTSYSYFPHTMTSYAVSNASDDLGERESNTLQEDTRNRPAPMNTLSSDDVGAIYNTISNFGTSSPPLTLQSTQTAVASTSTTTESCHKHAGTTIPAAPSIPPQSPSAGRSIDCQGEADTSGCGCSISPNMCCCGELCACPGCLAYPNNQNILDTNLAPGVFSANNLDSNNNNDFSNSSNSQDINQSPTNGSVRQKGSCCSTNQTKAVSTNDLSLQATSNSAQALNLSQALSLIGANSQNASTLMDNDARQALQQGLTTMMGQNGMESVKMQHPTLLGDNGVLICGCGCGRPTVDCVDCFRDMCEFVGESQARMMKEELEFDMAMNREGGYLADLGLNMNMSMAMNIGLNMTMDMNMDINDIDMDLSLDQDETQSPDLRLAQNQDAQGSINATSINGQQQQQQQQQQLQEQQQHQQTLSSPEPLQFQNHRPSQDQALGQYQHAVSQDQGQGQHQYQTQQKLQEQQHLQQLTQQQQHSPRHQDPLEQEQRLRLQLLEQEQMQLSQLQPSSLNQLQLDFLDDQDWSFVDEIRTDDPDVKMPDIERS
ncbi:hypothetical protein BGZ58_010951 [Dissophora ornata]|nr:hypothetical protein BGZ58_010951 [Dissophora ornata]